MNRRNFIKSFSAIAASVPIASALANTKGVEPIIETFQMSDIDQEVISSIKYAPEAIVNRNLEIGQPILVLAKNYSRFSNFIREHRFEQLRSIKNIIYVNDYMNILGYERGMKIIGLYEYWEHPNINDILRHTYLREMSILNPDKFFKEII